MKATRHFHTPIDRAIRLILKARDFKSTYVKTAVARHHIYQGKGSGTLPPVVLLHGGSDSAASFLPLMLFLKKHVKEVIAVEAAGHGLSSEPTDTYTFTQHYASMNKVLDQLLADRDPVVIVGNSLGALTAIHYTNHSPKRVCGLFLISPMGAPMTHEQLEELRVAFSPKTLAEARVFAKRVHPSISKLRARFIAPITLSWLKRQAITDLVQGTTVNDHIAAKDLKSLKIPITVVIGSDDYIISPTPVTFFAHICLPLPHFCNLKEWGIARITTSQKLSQR